MSKRVLAGSSIVDFYDEDMNLVVTANTLTDSGLNVTVSKDAIRGGDGHQLLANYFYESGLTLTFTDPLFSFEYLSMKFGSDVTMGSDVQITETITTTVVDQITVSQTPTAFPNTNKIVGAYKVVGTDTWTTITFVGKNAVATGVAIGTQVCVKYFYLDNSAKELTISSAIIPKIMYAVMRTKEFKSGVDNSVLTSSSQVGELQTVIPQLQLDPNQDLALTSSGHATTSINGEALVNQNGGCNGDGFYAILTETTIGGDPFANCIAIGVADGDIDLSTTHTTETLKVYGFYNDGTAPSLLDNSLLTFVSGTTAIATVNSAGVVTRVASGSSVISVTVTSKTSLSTTANVTSV